MSHAIASSACWASFRSLQESAFSMKQDDIKRKYERKEQKSEWARRKREEARNASPVAKEAEHHKEYSPPAREVAVVETFTINFNHQTNRWELLQQGKLIHADTDRIAVLTTYQRIAQEAILKRAAQHK